MNTLSAEEALNTVLEAVVDGLMGTNEVLFDSDDVFTSPWTGARELVVSVVEGRQPHRI